MKLALFLLVAGAGEVVLAGNKPKTHSPSSAPPTTPPPTKQPITSPPVTGPPAATKAPVSTPTTPTTEAPAGTPSNAPSGGVVPTMAPSNASGTTSAPTQGTTTMAPTAAPVVYVPNGLLGNTYQSTTSEVLPVLSGDLETCNKVYAFTATGLKVSMVCNNGTSTSGSGGRRLGAASDNTTNTTSPTTSGTTMAPTSSQQTTLWSLEIATKTMSCGQNVQTGMVMGVLGGPATVWEMVPQSNLLAHPAGMVVCAAYTSTSAIWAGNSAGGAILNMKFWVQPQPRNGTSSSVYCATEMPTEAQAMAENYPMDEVVTGANGHSVCMSGPCKTSPLAMYTCWSNGHQTWFDQGVGMSVGGIGMIITTITMIVLAGRYTVSM